MSYRPKLDPETDLAGATPESLALALLGKRREALRQRPGGESIEDDQQHASSRREISSMRSDISSKRRSMDDKSEAGG